MLMALSAMTSIKTPKEETSEKLVKKEGYCLLNNIKTGIWIAGTMMTLDARHIEFFQNEEYRSGSWDYHLLGSHNVNKQADGAFGGIFDVKYLNDESTSVIFDLKSWGHQQPQNCGGYPGFSLTCSGDIGGRGAPLLTLPYSRNFSVRYISYLIQEIQLYDADGCLPRKLMALNLTSSPFEAMYMDEFVFLSCPRAVVAGTGLATVDCLGNSTSAVVATTSGTLSGSMSMCTPMFTLPIPVSWDDGGGGSGSDLRLTWSFPDCKGCEARGGVCGYDRNSTVVGITCYFDHGKGNH
ncbi:hypothetical protein SASPL_147417 [Salvia splendens]|uniref:RING-type E3 ubiquitin transferase n=1 Tax=Salvia splendens TaxID=180675 RepID=A0A8X8WFS2_SALSN|nr:hypothetical protein SASPL_147417 [Salvia splendens]